MVLPIGFFMPLPLAMMIPFMGIQSAVMAKQFGENFQYGKRRISAMSNEEFNKLTPKMIQDNANDELKAMIPSMEASIGDMREFQKFVIEKFVQMIEDLIHGLPQNILDILQIDIKLHDDDVTQPIISDIPDQPESELQTLTIQQVNQLTQNSLEFNFNNPQRFDTVTNQRIKNELERRQRHQEEPLVDPNLHPIDLSTAPPIQFKPSDYPGITVNIILDLNRRTTRYLQAVRLGQLFVSNKEKRDGTTDPTKKAFYQKIIDEILKMLKDMARLSVEQHLAEPHTH